VTAMRSACDHSPWVTTIRRQQYLFLTIRRHNQRTVMLDNWKSHNSSLSNASLFTNVFPTISNSGTRTQEQYSLFRHELNHIPMRVNLLGREEGDERLPFVADDFAAGEAADGDDLRKDRGQVMK
jgi:hypothetical protein